MNIILDTHIFLWVLTEPERLNQKYLEYIENLSNEIFISSISIAEIESIKINRGEIWAVVKRNESKELAGVQFY